MMNRFILILGLLATLGLAAAQSIVIAPPVDGDGDDQAAVGTDSASVSQEVVLEIPKATGLHLTADFIEYDIGNDLGTLKCVYATGPDTGGELPGNYPGQTVSVPGGIAYGTPSWPNIDLRYYGNGQTALSLVPDSEIVQRYPPIDPTGDGIEVDNATKRYFVCYQTFVMQLFANYADWQLLVERGDLTDQGIEHLYVQANTCANFGTYTGLFELVDAAPAISLIPDNLNDGTTGALATGDASNNYCRSNTSWLDVLGVMAVKVNADEFGTNTANLTYSLVSPDWLASN